MAVESYRVNVEVVRPLCDGRLRSVARSAAEHSGESVDAEDKWVQRIKRALRYAEMPGHQYYSYEFDLAHAEAHPAQRERRWGSRVHQLASMAAALGMPLSEFVVETSSRSEAPGAERSEAMEASRDRADVAVAVSDGRSDDADDEPVHVTAGRGVLAGLMAATFLVALQLGYGNLPDTPHLAASHTIAYLRRPRIGPSLCSELSALAELDPSRLILSGDVAFWTMLCWTSCGVAFALGFRLILASGHLRTGRWNAYAAASTLGAVCCFVGHQLPARDARVPPGGIVMITRGPGELACFDMGGPLGEPDFEGVAMALAGGWVAACLLLVRRRSIPAPFPADAARVVVGCLLLFLLTYLAFSGLVGSGADEMVRRMVPGWLFSPQFPHRERVVACLVVPLLFFVSMRAPTGPERSPHR